MPKQVVTENAILSAALEMTRKQGYESVNARSVAEFMGRSVQPIYSYFQNMETLKSALYQKAAQFYDAFIAANSDRNDLQSMGRANVKFARQEPNLFRLLYLSKLDYRSVAEIYETMAIPSAAKSLSLEKGISQEDAARIYKMMIVFTHGIAAMIASGGADLAEEETDRLIKDAYRAFTASGKEK